MTLVSLCSYTQRDYTKMPYYFFIEDLDSTQFYVAEVIERQDTSKGLFADSVNYVKDIKYYYDDKNNNAVVFELNKNTEYKIAFKLNNKTVKVYTTPAEKEPRYFPTMDVDLSSNKIVEMYYDIDKQYYLLDTKILK